MVGEMKASIESIERANKLHKLLKELVDKSGNRAIYKNFNTDSVGRDKLIKDSTKCINKIKNEIIEMFEVKK